MRMTAYLVGAVLLFGLAACDTDDEPYTGPHGVGALVDNPDDPENWPLCSDGARHPDCSYAPNGY